MSKGKEKLYERIKELYERSVETDDLKYDGKLNDIDFFGLFCKATSKDKLFKILGCNLCIFNYVFEDEDSTLFIFAIPNGEDSGTKQIADKIIEIISVMERCFIVLDYIETDNVKDDKFVYMTIVKKVQRKR